MNPEFEDIIVFKEVRLMVVCEYSMKKLISTNYRLKETILLDNDYPFVFY